MLFLWVALLAGFFFPALASKVCSRRLQEILYDPPSCAEKYFAEIDAKLRQYEALLFTSQAQAIIDQFENTFGVSITTTPTTGSQCNTYVNLDAGNITRIPTFFSFDNSNAPATPITSLKISVNLETGNTVNLRLYLTYFRQSVNFRSLALFFQNCVGNPGLVATFEDGGAGITNNCGNLNDGLTLAADQNRSIISSLTRYGVMANTPIYLALTKVNNVYSGDINFFSANMTICSSLYYSYDFARSNLNVPGLRYDAGLYHYTAVYRDQFAQMQYITISANLTGLTC